MPYVTTITQHTVQIRALRMSRRDALARQFNTDEVQGALHSKGFFETRTFKTDNTRVKVLAAGKLLATAQDRSYSTFRIPKQSGGTRIIEAPNPELKIVQSSIAQTIQYDYQVLAHNAAYAYSRGRCAYDALVTHQRANARWFLKVDIKNFFPSITSTVLAAKLPDIYPLNYLPQYAINNVIRLAVNDRCQLPQGSPLSPLLSNLVMIGFDHDLTKELRRYHGQTLTYTRYADDMLISCPYEFKFQDVLATIQSLFTKHALPFTLNHEKTRYASMAGRNWNLGLMYNKDQQITVGTKRKKELHSLVNSFIVDDINGEPWSSTEVSELIGKLGYLKNVEPDYYQTLVGKYERKYNIDLPARFRTALNCN
jgi:RNA-directed DNA polymerase